MTEAAHSNVTFSAQKLGLERGGRKLFENLGFELRSGQALQIKGLNGAGKSSLLNLLAGISQADVGEIFWNHVSIQSCYTEFHSALLFIGHKAGINLQFSAEQNLKYYAQIQGKNFSLDAMQKAFKYWGLFGFEDMPAKKLSAGQKRRIALCRLQLEEKPLWILDEPLVSLDDKGIAAFRTLVETHLSRNGALIFSSHQDIGLGSDNLSVLDLHDFINLEQEQTEREVVG